MSWCIAVYGVEKRVDIWVSAVFDGGGGVWVVVDCCYTQPGDCSVTKLSSELAAS